MTHAFSIKEAIRFGWHKLKSNSRLVFGVVLTMFALQVASSMVENSLKDTVLGAVASLVLAVLGIILGAGATFIVLKLARGEHAHYRDIVPAMGLVWKYFCTSLLTGIITFLPFMAGGLVSLAILASTGSINFSEGAPIVGHEVYFALAAVVILVSFAFAVYFAIRYSFARLAVLDGADILESLKKSTKLTHNIKWRMVLFVLAIIVLNLLGLVALVVGLLVTIPISLLAFAHVYLKLKAHHGHN